MITLRADEIWPELLGSLTEPVNIVDAEDRVLGRFTPDPERIQRLYADVSHLPDAAEIERRKHSPERAVTTIELFEHLLSLAQTDEDRENLTGHIRDITERHIKDIIEQK
ncbi:MAG TPA: hypothetical protein VKA46_36710 [Gemmataceae bacterium]|nr:hypothetical protein [Gemmataceae bacterium]